MVETLLKLKAGVEQSVGKVRRFTYGTPWRPEKRARKLARRRGECSRCGACCKLLFKCPLLEIRPDGSTSCRIHEKRPPNCRLFPLDERDLAERDHQLPETPCGYYFVEEEIDDGAGAED